MNSLVLSIRTGKEYIKSLKDSREVFVRGEKVADLETHPSFAGIVKTIAKLYDLQNDPAYADQMVQKENGGRYANRFTLVKKPEDMKKLRSYSTAVANETGGLLGSGPEYGSALVSGLYNSTPVIKRFNPKFAKNVFSYYNYSKDNDLAAREVLAQPQIDRSKGPKENGDLTVMDENDEGIIVDGARMLSTLGPIVDEILIYPGHGQSSTGDDSLSAWFAIPVATRGVKFLCREDYASGRSSFDHPLATAYDESDAMVIFDNVLVPWERVFVAGKGAAKVSTEILSGRLLGNWATYTALTRSLAKLKFFLGATFMMIDDLGVSNVPHIQEKLGEIVIYSEILENCLTAAENSLVLQESGLLNPSWASVSHPRVWLSWHVWPRVVEIIRPLLASGLIMLPTEKDFKNPEEKPYIEKYLRGKDVSASEKVKLFRLLVDAIADMFGSRQLQYEIYFAGDPVRLKMSYSQTAKKAEYVALAKKILDNIPSEI